MKNGYTKPVSRTLLVVATALGVAGCITMPQGADRKTTDALTGGALGCAGGAILAKLAGGNAATGCLAGAVVGGLIGFEQARKAEISAAERAQNEALQAMAALPPAQRGSAGELKTVEVVATDKSSRETRKYQAFESVSIDVPLSTKGTPEHATAMGKLKALAERVADERGSADIVIAMAPNEVRARKVALTSDQVRTAKGNTITVSRVSDSKAPVGMERITVKAGKLRLTEV